jgi:protein SCO1/2
MKEQKKHKGHTAIIFILVIAISLVSGIWVSRFFDAPQARVLNEEEYSARLFEPPLPLRTFELKDHKGKIYNPTSMLGYWTFIFFGYTNCPDICPMALVDLNAVYDDLKGRYVLGNTKVAFVSVDPDRDSLNHLAEYVSFFNEDFLGIKGNDQQVADFSSQFGAMYKQVANEEDKKDYLVDHTASIMLVDHLGRLVAIFPPPHEPKTIVAEFLKLRDRYGDGYGCLIN